MTLKVEWYAPKRRGHPIPADCIAIRKYIITLPKEALQLLDSTYVERGITIDGTTLVIAASSKDSPSSVMLRPVKRSQCVNLGCRAFASVYNLPRGLFKYEYDPQLRYLLCKLPQPVKKVGKMPVLVEVKP